jgi:hypothetical protein
MSGNRATAADTDRRSLRRARRSAASVTGACAHEPGNVPCLVMRDRLVGDATRVNAGDVSAGLG